MVKLACAIVCLSLEMSVSWHVRAVFEQDAADQLVRELRELPASLSGMARSDGTVDPVEQRRRRLYGQILQLGEHAMPSLARGLADPDVQVRRNVALFLNVVGGGWFDSSQTRLNIEGCLTALIAALQDRDGRVRELTAQAIGQIGPSAIKAVPALVRLLADSDEGSRNSACIGLTGIGPAAKDALPALHNALSDPSGDVRRFARRAIEKIESRR